MAIPISIFYYIYLIFVAIFLIFTFFNVYHLLRFGFLSLGNIAVTFFYITITILILSVSWGYLNQIDWQQTFSIIPQLP
ncbi:MAG: hypothetical protein WCW26_01970 [Candidatus Buchananbacteria bacterium]